MELAYAGAGCPGPSGHAAALEDRDASQPQGRRLCYLLTPREAGGCPLPPACGQADPALSRRRDGGTDLVPGRPGTGRCSPRSDSRRLPRPRGCSRARAPWQRQRRPTPGLPPGPPPTAAYPRPLPTPGRPQPTSRDPAGASRSPQLPQPSQSAGLTGPPGAARGTAWCWQQPPWVQRILGQNDREAAKPCPPAPQRRTDCS